MARLQDVIASVLRDVLSAQHQANLLTESLADQYREAGVMHQLNLPAVTTLSCRSVSQSKTLANCSKKSRKTK